MDYIYTQFILVPYPAVTYKINAIPAFFVKYRLYPSVYREMKGNAFMIYRDIYISAQKPCGCACSQHNPLQRCCTPLV